MKTEKLLVMVVEDEQLLLKAVETKLEKTGKQVIKCESAEEALVKLKTMQKLPDVIWLDYYLKDMNGLEFMTKLKANANWAEIPVVVVSNSASTEKVSQMMALGVKKYLLKAESRLDELMTVLDEVHRTGKGAGNK
jgi:two-component system chemotaxis response regulator CheY